MSAWISRKTGLTNQPTFELHLRFPSKIAVDVDGSETKREFKLK